MRLEMVHPSETQHEVGDDGRQRDMMGGLKVKSRNSGAATRQVSLESLHKMMAEMEESKPFKPPAIESASQRDREQRHLGSCEETGDTHVITGRPVSFETKTFAQAVQDSYGENMMPLSTMTDRQKRSRKEQQEADRARRAASRFERQTEADEAKIHFGLSSTEKKERAKRAERMEQQQYDNQREKAVTTFARRSRRVLLSNFIALITQVRAATRTLHHTHLTPHRSHHTQSACCCHAPAIRSPNHTHLPHPSYCYCYCYPPSYTSIHTSAWCERVV
jgi:hypothetical protein